MIDHESVYTCAGKNVVFSFRFGLFVVLQWWQLRKKKEKKHFGDFCRYVSVNDQKRMLSMMKKEIKDRCVLCCVECVCVCVWKRKRDVTYSKKKKGKNRKKWFMEIQVLKELQLQGYSHYPVVSMWKMELISVGGFSVFNHNNLHHDGALCTIPRIPFRVPWHF